MEEEYKPNQGERLNRQALYQEQTDYLFFEMQEAYLRGDNVKGDMLKAKWLQKKDEIRKQFPYPFPEEDTV